jgi:hypothetical protein
LPYPRAPRAFPSGFIEWCQPSKAARPPSGPLWVHEIKHDGYRLMVRRDDLRVRCFTRWRMLPNARRGRAAAGVVRSAPLSLSSSVVMTR